MPVYTLSISIPVSGVLRAGVDGLHDDEGVQEVGGDHVGGEGRVGVLEDDGHDVVANVPLPLQLLRLALRVGQERGHVEHDLLPSERFIQALQAGFCTRVSPGMKCKNASMYVVTYRAPL